MGQLLVWFLILGLGFAVLNIWVLRRVFRINEIVQTLESIDRSLQYLPAVRDARVPAAQRRASQ